MIKFKTMLTTALLLLAASGAHAISVNVTATADNAIVAGGLCGNSDCNTGTIWPDISPVPNTDWEVPQTWTLDLGMGTHWFSWNVENTGTPNSGNPAGLLAEITWAGGKNSSSSAWEVNSQPNSSGTWSAATEWAQNGTGFWGAARPGISTDAYWIYGDVNFNADTPANRYFRTSITIAALPEPGMLALLIIGLAGMISARRRA